jgi:hypothetical protein
MGMTDTADNALDFDAYLVGRGITHADYEQMPEELRRYLLESWQFEHHISAPPVMERPPEQAAGPGKAIPSAGWGRLPARLLPACLVLLVVTVGSLAITRTRRAPFAGTGSASVEAVPMPAAIQPQAAIQAGWTLVGRTGGSGTQKMAPFTVAGSKWRIAWMTRPSAEAGAADFLITVQRPDGSTVGPAAHTLGENEGEIVLRGAGAYVLEVSSRQKYLIRVYDHP